MASETTGSSEYLGSPGLDHGGRVGAGGSSKIGALARPDDLIFASNLPKTRSGKIMRRLLCDIAEGKAR